jgi:CCAAT-binding transcription factor (CBF-B/NF-YA) subunit B
VLLLLLSANMEHHPAFTADPGGGHASVTPALYFGHSMPSGGPYGSAPYTGFATLQGAPSTSAYGHSGLHGFYDWQPSVQHHVQHPDAFPGSHHGGREGHYTRQTDAAIARNNNGIGEAGYMEAASNADLYANQTRAREAMMHGLQPSSSVSNQDLFSSASQRLMQDNLHSAHPTSQVQEYHDILTARGIEKRRAVAEWIGEGRSPKRRNVGEVPIDFGSRDHHQGEHELATSPSRRSWEGDPEEISGEAAEDVDEEPLFVNAKQYQRIIKRRATRARIHERKKQEWREEQLSLRTENRERAGDPEQGDDASKVSLCAAAMPAK